jgi:hypothetical protein
LNSFPHFLQASDSGPEGGGPLSNGRPDILFLFPVCFAGWLRVVTQIEPGLYLYSEADKEKRKQMK